MKLGIEANKIYRPLWQSKKRYIIVMGGRGAGRSYETSQKIVGTLVQTKRTFRAAIMRAIHTDIRHSIWQELKDRIDGWNIDQSVRIADSTMEITRGKNSVHAHGFKKSSSDRTAKLKSLASYTDAFIEEAEEIGEEEFRQLDDSLRAEGSQIHLCLNTPAKSHWIVRRWFNVAPIEGLKGFYRLELKPEAEKDVEFIFSTHETNTHLADAVHERYEGYKRTKAAYYWQMIRGLCPETVMGRIYSGWREMVELPHEARYLGSGLDFGFDPDPVAYLDVYYHNGGYILDERIYANGITNTQLATNIKLFVRHSPIVGDSAEPKSIAELSDLGVHVIPCEKGADSVYFGIKHVQALRISYTARSKNLKAEYENYAWKRNKDAVEENDHLGIEDPKCANHLMSAARYFLTAMVKANADPEADLRREGQMQHNREKTVSTVQADAGL